MPPQHRPRMLHHGVPTYPFLRSGDCLCTNAECTGADGKALCPPPFLPGNSPPPPPPGPSPPPGGTSPPPEPPPMANVSQPPALRNADGSCAVLPGSAFTQDISGLPKHPNSE